MKKRHPHVLSTVKAASLGDAVPSMRPISLIQPPNLEVGQFCSVRPMLYLDASFNRNAADQDVRRS
jgi:hypothetical protein